MRPQGQCRICRHSAVAQGQSYLRAHGRAVPAFSCYCNGDYFCLDGDNFARMDYLPQIWYPGSCLGHSLQLRYYSGAKRCDP